MSASTEAELPQAFDSLVQEGTDVLCVEADWFLNNPPERLVALSVHHALPTIYSARELVVAGGLMSYGTDRADAYRIMGTYAGRILKGEKPSDLPVQQSTRSNSSSIPKPQRG